MWRRGCLATLSIDKFGQVKGKYKLVMQAKNPRMMLLYFASHERKIYSYGDILTISKILMNLPTSPPTLLTSV